MNTANDGLITSDWEVTKLLNSKGQSASVLVHRETNEALCLAPKKPCTGSLEYLSSMIGKSLKRYFTVEVEPIIDLDGYYYITDFSAARSFA